MCVFCCPVPCLPCSVTFSKTVPQQELLLLLATGACTPPLHSFLSSTLGEAGLRRLARGTDAALSGLHTALLERLVPLSELVCFLLGELRGAVLASGTDAWMGLQVCICVCCVSRNVCAEGMKGHEWHTVNLLAA